MTSNGIDVAIFCSIIRMVTLIDSLRGFGRVELSDAGRVYVLNDFKWQYLKYMR